MLNLYTYALDNEKKLATESVNVPKIVKNESVFENMVNARLLDSFANVNTVARANYAAAIDTLEKAIKPKKTKRRSGNLVLRVKKWLVI